MDVASHSGVRYCDEMRFHEKVAKLIDRRGLTQTDLARMADMKPSQINRLVSGDRPTVNLLNALHISRALGVSMEYLVDDAQDEPPPPEFSEGERQIIGLVRLMGEDVAMRRLTLAPPQDDAREAIAGSFTDLKGNAEGVSGRVSDSHDKASVAPSPDRRKPGR